MRCRGAVILALPLALGMAAPARAVSAPVVSYDVRVPTGHHGALVAGHVRIALPPGRHRIEIERSGRRVLMAVDLQPAGSLAAAPRIIGATVSRRLATGTALADRLAHRLAALHDAAPPGVSVRGTDRRGRLRLSHDWMAGFWPGALWGAADGHPQPFGGWALDATRALSGGETADTHDLGMIYGRSAFAGWQRRCTTGRPNAACGRLAASAVAAARSLAGMLARSPTGTLPTREQRCGDCGAGWRETIVDSLSNLELLPAAADLAGRPEWRALAARAAHRTVELLVRPDGSTTQAIYWRADDGALGALHTHQGAADASTWARGEAWALHGTASLADALDDPDLHDVSERIAAYTHARLDAGGLPRWDYGARRGPTDASAAALTAAGLARLARLDDRTGRPAEAAWHRALASDLLARIDAIVSRRPPVGRFAGQVYTYGGPRWDEDAEFMLGVDYTLEAIGLLNSPP